MREIRMPASDPIDILLAHDAWATRQVLASMEPLPPERLHQRFEIGPGSLHDTLVHIVGAMRIWTDVLALRPVRPWIDDSPRRTVAALRRLHDEAAADLAGSARAGPLDQVLERERLGEVYRYTRAAILMHVATHAVHHRAQALNMLRHLGVSPLPASSVVEWCRAGAPA
jgi:uncharacterized damage-inducible protein DinB